MAAVNKVCANLVDNVINSGLDFTIHQTPYSIHFSLRKKFSKNSSNKIPMNSPSFDSLPNETELDKFRQELLHTRNEYVKLYNLYAAEHEARCKLEGEYNELVANNTKEEQKISNVKALSSENKSLKDKLETKCLELSHLKTDLENIKKEKNTLSVALKASKADIKEQRKAFEKTHAELELKVVELDDYRKNKLREEREVKRKTRKELKKTNQKLKKEKEKELSTEEDTNRNEINLRPVETTKPETLHTSEVLEKKPDAKHNLEAGVGVGGDSVEEPEPMLMSETEKEEFVKEMQARVDEALKGFWSGW